MSDDKLIHVVLKGLGSKFKNLSATIRARDTLISFEELHDKLVDYELTLKHNETLSEKPNITVQFNKKTNINGTGRHSQFTNNKSVFPISNTKPTHLGNYNNRLFPTIGSPSNHSHSSQPNTHVRQPHYNNNKPFLVCQLC